MEKNLAFLCVNNKRKEPCQLLKTTKNENKTDFNFNNYPLRIRS